MELTEQQYKEIYKDFQKCADVALKLSSMFLEETKAWTGTISERLEFLTNKLIEQVSEKRRMK